MKNRGENSQILAMIGLYQKDPEVFEKMRADIIRRTIETFPEEHRQRARGLQFQLEMKLRRYRDPVSRMNAMAGIFWEQFEEFSRVLNDPLSCLAERQAQPRPGARILPLKHGPSRH
jgi:hypothetical protein